MHDHRFVLVYGVALHGWHMNYPVLPVLRYFDLQDFHSSLGEEFSCQQLLLWKNKTNKKMPTEFLGLPIVLLHIAFETRSTAAIYAKARKGLVLLRATFPLNILVLYLDTLPISKWQFYQRNTCALCPCTTLMTLAQRQRVSDWPVQRY